jgi:hypothetical protein
LTVEGGTLKIENVEIYDVSGRKQGITVNSPLSTVNSIDISHLANGVYFLKIGNESVKVVKK